MKYVSILCHPVSYRDMAEIYSEVKELYNSENFNAMDELYTHVSSLMNQSEITEQDVERYDELRGDVMAQFMAEEREYNLKVIGNLIGNSEGSHKDDEKSERFWLSAEGCYSSKSILKYYDSSVTELKATLKELGVSKDDYEIGYDDETCHLTLPESLLKEIYKIEA